MAMLDTMVLLVQMLLLLLLCSAAAEWLSLVFVLVFEMVKTLLRQKWTEKKRFSLNESILTRQMQTTAVQNPRPLHAFNRSGWIAMFRCGRTKRRNIEITSFSCHPKNINDVITIKTLRHNVWPFERKSHFHFPFPISHIAFLEVFGGQIISPEVFSQKC